MAPPAHIPVLLEEVVSILDPRRGEVYLDCTAGLGGHAAAVASRMGEGTVLLSDLDATNLERAERLVREAAPGVEVHALHMNFAQVPWAMRDRGIEADMVLADLGFASTQVDDPERGFSFREDGPLDMRLDASKGVPASELVNTLDEASLADVLYRFGEERLSRRIARKVVETRRDEPIRSTRQLARIVQAAYPKGSHRIHPATRTFQALRIAVNDELGSLDALLERVRQGGWLHAGARVAIIAFHSLEDRPVKRCFADLDAQGIAERLTRKPIRASDEESRHNPRSRSARLRAVRLQGFKD